MQHNCIRTLTCICSKARAGEKVRKEIVSIHSIENSLLCSNVARRSQHLEFMFCDTFLQRRFFWSWKLSCYLFQCYVNSLLRNEGTIQRQVRSKIYRSTNSSQQLTLKCLKNWQRLLQSRHWWMHSITLYHDRQNFPNAFPWRIK